MMLSDSTSYKSPPSRAVSGAGYPGCRQLDLLDNIVPNIANGVEEEES
jgi:hypothetical protein